MHVSSLLSVVLASSLLAGDVSAGRLSDIARDPHRLRKRTATQPQTLQDKPFRFLNNQTKGKYSQPALLLLFSSAS